LTPPNRLAKVTEGSLMQNQLWKFSRKARLARSHRTMKGRNR
jgi:hypothetical protein